MPRKLSAFFNLSLEENPFVEHGCVRRGRLPRDGLWHRCRDSQCPAGPLIPTGETTKS
jgi:hypothetical protein